jgi:hypothetical protein
MEGVGKWRISKTEDIIMPLKKLELTRNIQIPIKPIQINNMIDSRRI